MFSTNTAYFHHKANSRQWRNYIKGLEDEEGHWQDSKHEIERIVVSYFEQLFKSTDPADIELALEGIHCKVTNKMNA